MNARCPEQPAPRAGPPHLDWLEEEAIFILREVAASFERPALLFSGGKDSCVVLRLAEKAFKRKVKAPSYKGKPALPAAARRHRPQLPRGDRVPRPARGRDGRAPGGRPPRRFSIARGTVRLAHPLESRNGHQTVTLLEAIEEHRFDALIGGARRDEEKARAKERIFSHRDSFGQWQPKEQRPELWTLFNTRIRPGEHFRASRSATGPSWTCGSTSPARTSRCPACTTPRARGDPPQGPAGAADRGDAAEAGETVETATVRFRTVGDMTCTCPVESPAASAADIVAETLTVTVSERGATRMDDRTSDASMERRKKEGYF
jgi:sulfate adenylyltransferase subunit 2